MSEQIRVSRLLHEGQRPKRHDPLQRLLLNIAGHHNDLARQTFALQGSQYLIAVHLRHGQVEQHHIGLPLAQNRHGLHAVGGLRDGDRPVGRQRTQQLLARHAGVVADKQSTDGHTHHFFIGVCLPDPGRSAVSAFNGLAGWHLALTIDSSFTARHQPMVGR
ncbi:hypothetical protein D3C86_1416020 [compost metagenome]